MLISAVTQSLLAALKIGTAGRLRGGPSFTDAFFPLVLLHWGQYETLLIGLALNLVATTFLGGLALLVVVRCEGVPSLRRGLLFGTCLLALPLCGSSGAALVPALVVWLAGAGLVAIRSGSPTGRRDGTAMLLLALAAAVLTVIYLLSLEKPAVALPRPTAAQAVEAAVMFLSNSVGPFAETTWPVSGVLLGCLGLAVVLKLIHDWRAAPRERLRTLGLLCFGAAMLCLAAGVGWGRGALGVPGGFATRYVTLAAPALCLGYFVHRNGTRRVVPWALFLLMAALLVVNTGRGLSRAEARRERMRELNADVARGMTPGELAEKWAEHIYAASGKDILTERFEMLRQARQGPYKDRPGD